MIQIFFCPEFLPSKKIRPLGCLLEWAKRKVGLDSCQSGLEQKIKLSLGIRLQVFDPLTPLAFRINDFYILLCPAGHLCGQPGSCRISEISRGRPGNNWLCWCGSWTQPGRVHRLGLRWGNQVGKMRGTRGGKFRMKIDFGRVEEKLGKSTSLGFLSFWSQEKNHKAEWKTEIFFNMFCD